MKKNFLFIGIGILVLIICLGSCGNFEDTVTEELTPTIEVTQAVTDEPTPTIEVTQTVTHSPTKATEPTATQVLTSTPKPTTAVKATVKLTPTPTNVPTQAPQNNTEMVWVTASGKKYHSHSSCSNMKSPYQISKEDAVSSGRSACNKCY